MSKRQACIDAITHRNAADASRIGRLGTHAFRHTHRSWLDAVGTPIAVQQKMMRHTDIRTTMNIYGDVVTDEMTTAGNKVARLAFLPNGAEAERNGSSGRTRTTLHFRNMLKTRK